MIGALSARDLLRLRAQAAIALGDEIDQADDVHAARACLGASCRRPRRRFCRRCCSGRHRGDHLARAWRFDAARGGDRRAPHRGRGAATPPCAYAFAVLGSAGRGESLLAHGSGQRASFSPKANRAARRIDGSRRSEITSPIFSTKSACLIAKAASWRKIRNGAARSQPGGRASRGWIEHSQPKDLLAVDIFFDLRGVHGDIDLAETLWREAFDAARGQAGFAKALADAAGGTQSGPRPVRRDQDRARTHRPQESMACSASSARRACLRSVITWSSVRLRRGLRGSRRSDGRRERSRRAGGRAGRVPAFHPGAADRGYRTRTAREQCRPDQTAVSARSRAAARGARGGRGRSKI